MFERSFKRSTDYLNWHRFLDLKFLPGLLRVVVDQRATWHFRSGKKDCARGR